MPVKKKVSKNDEVQKQAIKFSVLEKMLKTPKEEEKLEVDNGGMLGSKPTIKSKDSKSFSKKNGEPA